MQEGHWTTTYTGGAFSYTDPLVADVNIEDIAWALSNICRWGGHTSRFYSVAQHSILCARKMTPQWALYGLLHDAAEAYIGDISYPLKEHLGENIRALEAQIESVIAVKFDLTWTPEIEKEVKIVDDRMLATEAIQLTRWDTSGSKRRATPYAEELPWWDRDYVHNRFLTAFALYQSGGGHRGV